MYWIGRGDGSSNSGIPSTHLYYGMMAIYILLLQINDSWKRISDAMDVPIHELKKKKENLMATFRINLKKKMCSEIFGAGDEEVYHPTWMFYDVMAAFLSDVYEATSLMNADEKVQKRHAKSPLDLLEESNQMNTNFTVSNSALSNQRIEDDCDLFCKMLAKQIREHPTLERQEIMYELHGTMLNKRRRYERSIERFKNTSEMCMNDKEEY